MASNPYINHSFEKLKMLEKDILKDTRDPKMPGYKRRIALRNLRQIREAIKSK